MTDIFAKHRARRVVADLPGGKLDWLEWKDPETNVYAIWFVQFGSFLMCGGDFGDAVFRWSSGVTLEQIANCNLDYFKSKCQASAVGCCYVDWDSKAAQDTMKRFFEEADGENIGPDADVEGGPIAQRFDDAGGWGALETKFEWDKWCEDYAHDIFGDAWYEGDAGSPGLVTHPWCAMTLRALQAAIKWLEVNK